MSIDDRVLEVVRAFLAAHDRSDVNPTPQSALYQDGLGLDSMDAAELSVMLENTFGVDPYTEGELPHTVNDIITFYTAQPGGSK